MKWKKAKRKAVIVEFREVNGESEIVETLHGIVKANTVSDYIVKTVRGDIYPCDKLLFHELHDILNINGSLPKAICLVGSTHPKWKKRYREAEEELTKIGYVVLSVVWFKDQLPHFEKHRTLLETIHFQKIRLSDAVVLIHPDAVGKHTAMEIEFAKTIAKPVVTFMGDATITRASIESQLDYKP